MSGKKAKAIAGSIRIRKGPGTNHGVIGYLQKGDILDVSETSGNWLKHNKGGWSSTIDKGVTIIEIIQSGVGVITALVDVNIRDKPTTVNSKIIGTLKKGETVEILEQKGNWIRHARGWSCLVDKNGKPICKMDIKNESTPAPPTKEPEPTKPPNVDPPKENDTIVIKPGDDIDKPAPPSSAIDDDPTIPVSSLPGSRVGEYIPFIGKERAISSKGKKGTEYLMRQRGIHGLPYQFTETVDHRPNDSEYGRMYMDKILKKAPIMFLTPGEPMFMREYNDSERAGILHELAGKADETFLSEILNGRSGRYFSFKYDYIDYWKYVDLMCQSCAIMLGIQNEKLDGIPLYKYNWAKYSNSAMDGVRGKTGTSSVGFYVDAETSISESFSNNTTKSSLSDGVNSLSDTARELQFILGAATGDDLDLGVGSDMSDFVQKYSNMFSRYTNSENRLGTLFDRIGETMRGVANGGRMIFPEIWSDSSFSRSYNVNIKLSTPDGDLFSWYMNIAVPIFHLMAMAAPRQIDTNSYKAPFLVRAFYKGIFTIEMGLITGMDITRGDKSRWTTEGLPTEVEISLQLKDLYEMLSITPLVKEGDTVMSKIFPTGDLRNLAANTALMDYIGNMCGVNMNEPDLQRTVKTYWYLTGSQINASFNLTNNVFSNVNQAYKNILDAIGNRK